MLERLWGKGNAPALLLGVQVGITPLDISVAISQKIRKQHSSRSSNTTFGYKLKRCSTVPQGHVLNYVYSSIVCHSQNLETMQMPLGQRMDKENVVHLQNGVPHSRKKDIFEIFRQMDGSRKHHIE